MSSLPSRGNALYTAFEGNMFVRLIWIASATSLINMHLLLHFETDLNYWIHRNASMHLYINANPRRKNSCVSANMLKKFGR